MTPDQVRGFVGQLPYMRVKEGWLFYDFLQTNKLARGLELGFFHGVSSAYLAGALQELQGGHLTTVDLDTARSRKPNIQDVLQRANLSHLVDVHYEPRSFNWFLMRLLERRAGENFDFCYIDGGHTWYDSGFAFCLVKQLLAPGGWIVFDDLYFSFTNSSNRNKAWVQRLPEEEQSEQQVLRVFELLVQTDRDFTNFRRLNGRFAFAQKILPSSGKTVLTNDLSVAISLALERAHVDPEFRQALLLSTPDMLPSLLRQGTLEVSQIFFEESASRAPQPAFLRDGRWVVPVERPSWYTGHERHAIEQMRNRVQT